MGGKHDVRRQRPWDRSDSAAPRASGASRLHRRGQGQPAPVIPARAFGPVAGTQPGPALRRQAPPGSF